MPPNAQVTERTFYPALIGILNEAGGRGVSEVTYNSDPDIVFTLLRNKWILSVKIGETPTILKSAFLQYWRHKEESQLTHGLLLFLPESVRQTEATAESVDEALRTATVTCLVDTPFFHAEYRNIPFPSVIGLIIAEVGPELDAGTQRAYPLDLVIQLLKQHLAELMGVVNTESPSLLSVITDKKLLSQMGNLKGKDTEAVSRFLAAYIILSQILFMRYLAAAIPGLVPAKLRPVTRSSLRAVFRRILEVNYRPIYQMDVLDVLSQDYLEDTFDLIWGLKVEQIRYELPGRIFHELMPPDIRKMLAAFYTRPQAAELLATLCIPSATATVLDPACGSGTILVAAYRRKQKLWHSQGLAGNPHVRFCEDDIFGADIMPFAVHLTTANLASMEAGLKLDRTQIIQGDSLHLMPGKVQLGGVQLSAFPEMKLAEDMSGEKYKVPLDLVDCVLMNPPFTKVERGISAYVDMTRFQQSVGGEVGLWGHFVPLAGGFLGKGGTFGAVIPINILRGRESTRVREIIFKRWTPLYVLKPTRHYAFSEWAEYRDVIVVAKNEACPDSHEVKFGLVKGDLSRMTSNDTEHIATRVRSLAKYRSEDLDVETFPMKEINQRFGNLMWFCGVSDFNNRDLLVSFLGKLGNLVRPIPSAMLRTGYRLSGGLANLLCFTRDTAPSRVEQAFLRFSQIGPRSLRASTPAQTGYDIELRALTPSLRTPVGVHTMDITGKCDYVAVEPYLALSQVSTASGVLMNDLHQSFWLGHARRLQQASSNLVLVRRVNPYSPNNSLLAFASSDPFSPMDQFHCVDTSDWDLTRALCVMLNSVIFLAQFMLSKEETTGRYLDVRLSDLLEIAVHPTNPEAISRLVAVYDSFAGQTFGSLAGQLDQDFLAALEDYRQHSRRQGRQLSWLQHESGPQPERMEFDIAVCQALGLSVSQEELKTVYATIVREMIAIRALMRD